ncbi:ISL3 family transposase [Candidatus Poriferisodalis sp.]|uniref:ISL3 family transposase n=1 Tax=Candidatus Poriferisodalis sp. TaxID=3101277 RepID=UPI003B010481
MALVIAYAGLVGEHRRRRRCRVLLVDETSIRERHRYVTVLVNGDTGETLAMVPHRSEAALSGFLAAQGHRWQKGVKVVVSDGSAAYAAAIAKRLGHARHVLDRFHVIRWFAAGLTAVRRDVQRRPEGSKPAFDPAVFRARFLLMKRPDTLDNAERARLEGLFETHPRLKAAWDALGELHGLYLAKDRKGALEALDRSADIYDTGQIPEFSSVVDTFLAWHEQILDWHQAGQPSNGRIEGTNNLLQVLRRQAHGFTNHANFEARGILIA